MGERKNTPGFDEDTSGFEEGRSGFDEGDLGSTKEQVQMKNCKFEVQKKVSKSQYLHKMAV